MEGSPAENLCGASFYQYFSDLVFHVSARPAELAASRVCRGENGVIIFSENTLLMLKTSDSQFGPVFMLFYAALFLLLHGTTA